MLVPFNYIEEPLVKINCKILDHFYVMSQYGLHYKDVLNLCGGVPSADIQVIQLVIRSLYAGSLDVRVKCDAYELSRAIHLDAHFIYNNFLDVNWQRLGIGTKLLFNQVKTAQRFKIEKLKTVAQFQTGDGSQLNGYYCWGRLGYRMLPSDQVEFLEWARKHKRVEMTLFELLSSESGKKLWRLSGFEWSGEFMLEDNSINVQQLQQYLVEKGLPYTF